MKQLFIILLIILFASCNDKKTKLHIGDYVYLDTKNILHTDNGCFAVSKIQGGGQPVKLLEVSSLDEDYLNRICSQCVKKEQIASIRLLLIYNKEKERKAEEALEEEYYSHSLGYNIRQWLYVKLGGSENNIDRWHAFNKQLQEEDKRIIIYNTAKKITELPEYSKFCEEIDDFREDEVELLFYVDTVAVGE